MANHCSGGLGCGYIFQLVPLGGDNWTYNEIYQFHGGDGAHPEGTLIFDQAGNLYGTTGGLYGGDGNGNVFELTPSGAGYWNETMLYSFQDGSDGRFPIAGVIFDAAGNLYGASSSEGMNNGGAIFELTAFNGWRFDLLYSPSGSGFYADRVTSSLIMDGAGNLYGTNYINGAYNRGSVFKLSRTNGGWTYTSLHDFTGGSDGAYPQGSLAMDGHGNLYGTTFAGRQYRTQIAPRMTVISVASCLRSRRRNSCQWPVVSEKRLFHQLGCKGLKALDRDTCSQGRIVMARSEQHRSSVITRLSGSNGRPVHPAGLGYSGAGANLSRAVQLHRRAGRSKPQRIGHGSGGNFYGTTHGPGYCFGDNGACGGVFKFARSGSGWILTPLYLFRGGSDGSWPNAGVTIAPDGSLYGTTSSGGNGGSCNYGDTPGCGTVYHLRPPATRCASFLCEWKDTVLYAFHGYSDLQTPYAEVTFDQAGNLYGTAIFGGAYSFGGGVYKLTPSQGG